MVIKVLYKMITVMITLKRYMLQVCVKEEFSLLLSASVELKLLTYTCYDLLKLRLKFENLITYLKLKTEYRC